jgi:hypothetical protein
MNSTEFVVGNMKWESHLGRSRRGCSFTEWPYAGLDLRVKFFIELRSENWIPSPSLQSGSTKSTDRQILVSLNYLHNLSYLHEVTSISLVTWHAAASRGYVTNVVTFQNTYSRQQFRYN